MDDNSRTALNRRRGSPAVSVIETLAMPLNARYRSSCAPQEFDAPIL
jgi:hypothetical protein